MTEIYSVKKGRCRGKGFAKRQSSPTTGRAALASRADGKPDGASAMSARMLNILILEDHADTAYVFARVLRRFGHAVSVAHSLGAAEEMCTDHQFDLLICDIELPDGCGLEILKKARQTCPHTQGIVISAHDDKARRDAATAMGFAAYLVKPITAEAVKAAIAAVSRYRIIPLAAEQDVSKPPKERQL